VTSTTGRRHDSVHAQVLHHLTVVIRGVNQRVHDEPKASAIALCRDRLIHVLFVDCRRGAMKARERAIQIPRDFLFRLDRIGRGLVLRSARRFLSEDASAQLKVGCGKMFHLVGERAHTFEFAASGSK